MAAPVAELSEGEFLLDAVAQRTCSRGGSSGHGPRARALAADRGSVVWLVDLFERLERRDQAAAQGLNLS